MEGQAMPRQLATNAELTRMINDRFREGKELDGNCREVKIVSVMPYAEPDESGCNWDVYTYSGPLGCSDVFRLVKEEFRKQYNLQDD